MRGNQDVIALLGQALTAELTAINQYFLHAEMNQNWGYRRLCETLKKFSITEMKHAEKLIERILFLEGEPDLSTLGQLRIGKTPKEQMQNDLTLELAAVEMYNRASRAAAEAGDNGSRELFEELLEDEEGHVDWLETQLGLIREVGYERYLAEQMGSQP